MGARLVEGLEGSRGAKERLRVVLETLSGQKSIAEACRELGVGETAFYKMRTRWLREALGSLEPRRRGRPPKAKETVGAEEVRKLREEIEAVRREARIAAVREEIAVALPGVWARAEKAGKKTRLRRGS